MFNAGNACGKAILTKDSLARITDDAGDRRNAADRVE